MLLTKKLKSAAPPLFGDSVYGAASRACRKRVKNFQERPYYRIVRSGVSTLDADNSAPCLKNIFQRPLTIINITVIIIIMNQEIPDELLASVLCTTLMRVGTRMATLFDQNFAEYNITQSQFRILLGIYQLGEERGVAPSVLAHHLLIERGTVTVLTNPMVQRGWLSRMPGENRRTFQLCLTAAGHEKLQEVFPPARLLANQTLEGATVQELRQVLKQLTKLETHLKVAPISDGG